MDVTGPIGYLYRSEPPGLPTGLGFAFGAFVGDDDALIDAQDAKAQSLQAHKPNALGARHPRIQHKAHPCVTHVALSS